MQRRILIAFLFIFLIPQVASQTVVDRYFESNKINSEGWSVLHHNGPLEDTCGGKKLFGYFEQGAALVRGIQLPPHSGAQLRVVLWTFNKWANNEFIEIWIDQKLIGRRAQPQSKDQCDGEAYSTDVFTYEYANHQEETAVVVIYSTLGHGNQLASWGISHFTFSVYECAGYLCTNNSQDKWELSHQLWNSFDLLQFNTEGWSGSQNTVSCGVPFLGGQYDKIETKKRTFTLKPNYKSKIKFLFARFSNGILKKNQNTKPLILTIKINGLEWKQTQSLKLQFDINEGYLQDLCESEDLEIFYRYDFSLNLPNDKIEFEITSDDVKQAWGLRDFNIYILPCSTGCTKCDGPLGSDCQSKLFIYLIFFKACDDKYYTKITNIGCVPKLTEEQMFVFSQSFHQETFNDLDSWSVMKQEIAYFHQCSTLTIFGGYKQFDSHMSASKDFKLPYNEGYKIKFDLYVFGQWDDEFITVKVWGTEVYYIKIKTIQNKDFVYCGNEKLQGKIIPIETKVIKLNTDSDYEMNVSIGSTLENKQRDKTSWGFRNFELLYKPVHHCALLFTQINYKGEHIELCQSNIDFGLEKYPTQIKSILIPPRGKVTLFQKNEYQGKRYVFTQNTPIIEEELYLHLDGQNEQTNDL